jgi:predicted ester cyclase
VTEYAGAMSPETATKSPSRKGPTTIARAYFTALGEHDLDTAESLWQPGSIDRLVGMVEFPVPSPEFRAWFGGLFAAAPNFSFEIVSITAQKDTAATRYIARAKFDGTGKFEGLVPNGAEIAVEGCDVTVVEDGLIVANHGYLNGADMARQLGALPPQGSIAEKATTGALNAKVAAAKAIQRLRDR